MKLLAALALTLALLTPTSAHAEDPTPPPCPAAGCSPTPPPPCPEDICPPGPPPDEPAQCEVPDRGAVEALELKVEKLRASLRMEHRALKRARRVLDRKNATIHRLRVALAAQS